MEKGSRGEFAEVKNVSSVCIDSVDIREDGQIDTNLISISEDEKVDTNLIIVDGIIRVDGIEGNSIIITSWDKKSAREQYDLFSGRDLKRKDVVNEEYIIKGCDGTSPDDIFKSVFF